MLKSIRLLDDREIPPMPDKYRFSFEITDTDFCALVRANSYWEAVIQEYEKRNLNVAKNLVLTYKIVMELCNKAWSKTEYYDFMMAKSNGKYDKEIEKYMLLC
jgi:hypothetical protein